MKQNRTNRDFKLKMAPKTRERIKAIAEKFMLAPEDVYQELCLRKLLKPHLPAVVILERLEKEYMRLARKDAHLFAVIHQELFPPTSEIGGSPKLFYFDQLVEFFSSGEGSAVVQKWLNYLSAKDKSRIIRKGWRRLWIVLQRDLHGKTLSQIGSELKLTKERVRQLYTPSVKWGKRLLLAVMQDAFILQFFSKAEVYKAFLLAASLRLPSGC